MKQFLIKVIIFALLIFLIDRSFLLVRYNETNIFSDIAREKMTKIKSSFNSHINFDILIFGSSHSQFGISPNIISEQTGLTCLNIAYGAGANIGKQLNLLKQYINSGHSKKPIIILFGIEVFTLNSEPVRSDEFQNILLGKSANNFNIFNAKYTKSYITLYSRSIPRYFNDCLNKKYTLPYFRSSNTYDLRMFDHFDKYEVDELGWVKGYGILNSNYIRYKKTSFSPHKKSLIDLEEFITICKNNNIELIFFQTPEHEACLKYDLKYKKFKEYMNELVLNHSIYYLDYNSLEKFPVNDDSYFFDSDHLNIKGAKLFTDILIKKVITMHERTTLKHIKNNKDRHLD